MNNLSELRLYQSVLWNMIKTHSGNLEETIQLEQRQKKAIADCIQEYNRVSHQLAEQESRSQLKTGEP